MCVRVLSSLACLPILFVSACGSSSGAPSNGDTGGSPPPDGSLPDDSGSGVTETPMSDSPGGLPEALAPDAPVGLPDTLGDVRVNASANVKVTDKKQVIDGFGVSNAWLGTPADAAARSEIFDALFSVTKGAGLSILRNRIPFRESPANDDKFIVKNADGTYKSTTNADGSKTFSLDWSNWDLSGTSALIAAAKAAGEDYQISKFLSTPWTPPNNSVSKWKLSDATKTIDYVNAPEYGGYLDPSHYADYADLLADYVLGYKAKMGVDLTALSLQNEPSFLPQTAYESADWSAMQFHDFVGVLKTEFTKKHVFTQLPTLKLLAPEANNMTDTLVTPILSDPATASLLGIVAGHQYEFGTWNATSYVPSVLTASVAAAKPVWMTEWSTAAWADDASMTDALIVAKLVHQDLTIAGYNAFLYWWSWGKGNGVLVHTPTATTVSVPKRLYALGQFSRFVRPSWHRVTANAPTNGVLLSAFADGASSQIAIVAINPGIASTSLPLSVDVGHFGTMTAYRTSATENLANVGTNPGGGAVTVTLPAQSVTTFVATLSL